MKKIALLIILTFLFQSLAAQDAAHEAAQDMSDEKGITSSGELILQLSSLPGGKLCYSHKIVFPFLQGESFLTSENNVRLALTAEISPISLNGIAEAIWTPIAFIEVSTGARIGSGWNIELFGNHVNGIGLNKGKPDEKADGNAFDGLLWKMHAGAAFQFDLAAVIPGDWNHVVFRSYHEINHKGYSRAEKWEPWYFESDEGENCNGYSYYGNFLLGYQMPIFLNMIAVMAEMDKKLYDIPGQSQWGDDLLLWTFSGVLNFTVTKQFEIAVITQFKTARNFNESNWKDLHFRSRTVDKSDPLSLEFYRVAAILVYKIK